MNTYNLRNPHRFGLDPDKVARAAAAAERVEEQTGFNLETDVDLRIVSAVNLTGPEIAALAEYLNVVSDPGKMREFADELAEFRLAHPAPKKPPPPVRRRRSNNPVSEYLYRLADDLRGKAGQ